MWRDVYHQALGLQSSDLEATMCDWFSSEEELFYLERYQSNRKHAVAAQATCKIYAKMTWSTV